MIGEKLGNYRIVAKIGKGGMGAVYRAEHELMGRQAAIKVLLPELSNRADVVRRFFNEARATARLQHPSLVQIYDCGTHEPTGSAFLIMDFLDGESLGRRLQREGRLSVPAALDVARQTARGMAVVHAAGIIHRDLKPDNLFLVPHPGNEFDDVRILDFGVAKLTQANANDPNTRNGALLGTPTFMAPEQCLGAGEVDGRADVYSLGCLLFAMVTGRPPFAYRQVGQLLVAHAEEKPQSPRQFNDQVPEALAAEILKALAKNPDRRHQSMDELAEACADVDRSLSSSRSGRSRFNRGGAAPPMTEALPLPEALKRAYPSSSGSRAANPPSAITGATKMLPLIDAEPPSARLREPSRDRERSSVTNRDREREKSRPSGRAKERLGEKAREQVGTTLGDSPVELPASRPGGLTRWRVLPAAAAGVGLLGIVALTLTRALSPPSAPFIDPAPRAINQMPPFVAEPPEPFEPPPVTEEPPPPVTPAPTTPAPTTSTDPVPAPPRTASQRTQLRTKKLPFAPLPFDSAPSDSPPLARSASSRTPLGDSDSPSEPRPTASAASATVLIDVTNRTSDLKVTVDGVEVRLPVRLRRDGRTHIFRFSRPGQLVDVREVRADEDQLIRLAPPRPGATPTAPNDLSAPILD
jgi:serine/threonine protein kinase